MKKQEFSTGTPEDFRKEIIEKLNNDNINFIFVSEGIPVMDDNNNFTYSNTIDYETLLRMIGVAILTMRNHFGNKFVSDLVATIKAVIEEEK